MNAFTDETRHLQTKFADPSPNMPIKPTLLDNPNVSDGPTLLEELYAIFGVPNENVEVSFVVCLLSFLVSLILVNLGHRLCHVACRRQFVCSAG